MSAANAAEELAQQLEQAGATRTWVARQPQRGYRVRALIPVGASEVDHAAIRAALSSATRFGTDKPRDRQQCIWADIHEEWL